MRRECSGDGDDGREPFQRPAHWTTDKGKDRAGPKSDPLLNDLKTVLEFMLECTGVLPFRGLMMLLGTCKSFAKWKGSPQLACRCLYASIPRSVTDFQYLPDIGFSDALRVYKEYFFDVSTENSLFSARGIFILIQWIKATTTSRSGRNLQNNLPLDLAVLRKGGFFFSYYSRCRLVFILEYLIEDTLSWIMKMTVSRIHDNDQFVFCFSRAVDLLMKMGYLRKLAISSFAVSNSPIYSDSWKTIAMHDILMLPQVEKKWRVDIDLRDVDALYDKFQDCVIAPDMTKITRLFETVTRESHRGYILNALQNYGVVMFERYHFNMDCGFIPLWWHHSPYNNFSARENDSLSEFNEFWRIYMRLCRQRENWDVFVPFRPDFGGDWVTAVLRELDAGPRQRMTARLFRHQAYFDGYGNHAFVEQFVEEGWLLVPRL